MGDELVTDYGCTRIRNCPQAYHPKELDVYTVVHGDDFISESTAAGSGIMDNIMLKSFKTKIKCRIGPSASLYGEYLHRGIHFIEVEGFEISPDRKHTLLAARDLGLENATAVPTPQGFAESRGSG